MLVLLLMLLLLLLFTIINLAVGGGKHRKQLPGSPEQHDSSGRTSEGCHSQHTAR